MERTPAGERYGSPERNERVPHAFLGGLTLIGATALRHGLTLLIVPVVPSGHLLRLDWS